MSWKDFWFYRQFYEAQWYKSIGTKKSVHCPLILCKKTLEKKTFCMVEIKMVSYSPLVSDNSKPEEFPPLISSPFYLSDYVPMKLFFTIFDGKRVLIASVFSTLLAKCFRFRNAGPLDGFGDDFY